MERAGLIRGRVEGRREEADRQYNVPVYLYGNSVTLAPAMLILFFYFRLDFDWLLGKQRGVQKNGPEIRLAFLFGQRAQCGLEICIKSIETVGLG
jgi:hypothetical protein